MLWRDTVDLITISEFDAGNNVVQLSETSKTVFANKKSVNRDEFYKAFANDLKPTVAFEIRAIEYGDEQKLRNNGMDYTIIRTYSPDNETIELVCQAYNDVQTNLARLRDTVEIWHNTFVENSMGEQTPTAVRLYTVQAEIEYNGGGTGTTDGVTDTTNNAMVKIVYRTGITADMFLMVGGQRWDIRFIDDPFNRHETLLLHAERVVP